MQKSDSIKEIATALIEVQKEMVPVAKTKENPFFHSKYASLDAVMPKALAILNKHNLSLLQTIGLNGDVTTLTTMLMHSSGEWISDEQPLLLVKNDPQGQGSAVTYARRYALMSAIGMVADEDDDASKAAKASAKPTAPSKPISSPATYTKQNPPTQTIDDPAQANEIFDDISSFIGGAETVADINKIMADPRLKAMPFEMKKDLQSQVGIRIGQIKGGSKNGPVS